MKKLLIGIGIVSLLLTSCGNTEQAENIKENPDSIRIDSPTQTAPIPTDL